MATTRASVLRVSSRRPQLSGEVPVIVGLASDVTGVVHVDNRLTYDEFDVR
jgi:hypothetical protein